MPEVHRDAAALAPRGAVARRSGMEWRAPALLLYVVTGASLVVAAVGPITLALAALLAGPEPTPLSYEICARLAIGLSLIGLALVGGLLAKERQVPRAAHPMLVPLAFVAGIGALALALAASRAAGALVPTSGVAAGARGDLFGLGSALILLCVVGEEMLLRGLLQPVLVRAWGAGAGVPACALAFTAIHMVGGWSNPLSLLNILLAGIWFGLLAFRSGGLWAPIMAHFGYNWAEEMLFGASPNPGVSLFGSVIDVDLAGSTIWGGSMEGLNGSLAVSLLLAALIAPLALRRATPTSSGGAAARP